MSRPEVGKLVAALTCLVIMTPGKSIAWSQSPSICRLDGPRLLNHLSFFFWYQDEHMVVFSILVISNSKSDHIEAHQPQNSTQNDPRNCLSTCSSLLRIWHERTEGRERHQTDTHKVILVSPTDFTVKVKKEGVGGKESVEIL